MRKEEDHRGLVVPGYATNWLKDKWFRESFWEMSGMWRACVYTARAAKRKEKKNERRAEREGE